MYKTFEEIEQSILSETTGRKRLVLAGAADHEALSAVVTARRRGLIDAILLGNAAEILAILAELGEREEDYRIEETASEEESANRAMQMVHGGEADIPMKGLMQTASFMRAVLNREYGLVPEGALLSQTTVLEWPEKEKLLFISDCAINIAPDCAAKEKILRNAVELAHRLGVEMPRVAVISAVEVVREKIPSTLDAQKLAGMDWNDCIVGGPFALDNAVSEAAAEHKGIRQPAAGKADILIMPDLCTGNVFTKSLTFFAHLRSAGAVCGPNVPLVMTSRADTPENKYFSILTAVMQCRR